MYMTMREYIYHLENANKPKSRIDHNNVYHRKKNKHQMIL